MKGVNIYGKFERSVQEKMAESFKNLKESFILSIFVYVRN